ncbi:MAG: hypothetical protein J7527_03465, partial [Chitinophagaceae bacterium]|nr:hypothetical protein [Chitinophagaceae bacterium]
MNRNIFLLTLVLLITCLGLNAQQPWGLPVYTSATPVNFIRTWTATAPAATPAALMQGSLQQTKEATQYFDGLGRPLQTVVKKGSLVTSGTDIQDTAAAADLVTPVLYDAFGREQYKFLPFAANNAGSNTSLSDGQFKQNPFEQHQQFMNGQYGTQGTDKSYGYSQTVFEASPLNRVLEQFAPGANWAGTAGTGPLADHHSIKSGYWINTALDEVRIWNVTDGTIGTGSATIEATRTLPSYSNEQEIKATQSITLTDGFHVPSGSSFRAWITTDGGTGSSAINSSYANSGTYPAGELYKNVTQDEANRQVIEFKDKEGRIVLKKVQLTAAADDGTGSGHDNWLCTYYIYDDLNNLRCVIQPEGVKAAKANSWALTDNMLKEQCFRYEYDERNRMIVKQVPGAAEVFMVYDVRDRLVMSQDGNLRKDKLWNYTQYDNLNRPVKTGLFSSQIAGQPAHATAAMALHSDDNTAIQYPDADALTNGYASILTETFYDNYDWVTQTPYSTALSGYTALTSYESAYEVGGMMTSDNVDFPYQRKNSQDSRTKGLVTGTRTNVLGTGNYLYTTTIYDNKTRPIQVKSLNQTGGLDVITTQYSWSGQPLVVVNY